MSIRRAGSPVAAFEHRTLKQAQQLAMHRFICPERLGQAQAATASSEDLLERGAALMPRDAP